MEFWELILLAAGDIERNPGPITGSQTSLIPDLIRVIYYCCVGEQLAKVDNRVLGKGHPWEWKHRKTSKHGLTEDGERERKVTMHLISANKNLV